MKDVSYKLFFGGQYPDGRKVRNCYELQGALIDALVRVFTHHLFYFDSSSAWRHALRLCGISYKLFFAGQIPGERTVTIYYELQAAVIGSCFLRAEIVSLKIKIKWNTCQKQANS